jgi:hypothetical protein
MQNGTSLYHDRQKKNDFKTSKMEFQMSWQRLERNTFSMELSTLQRTNAVRHKNSFFMLLSGNNG